MPERVRCDKGGENIEVIRFVYSVKGTDKFYAIAGKSTRNQRIERLWKDVNVQIVRRFKPIFIMLENSGEFRRDDEIDTWALHRVSSNSQTTDKLAQVDVS